MTALLNMAAIAAPGHTLAGPGGQPGAAAGFDLLLASFFGEGEAAAMDPALAGLLGVQVAAPAPAAPAAPAAPTAVEPAPAVEATAEAAPQTPVDTQAAADAALALLAAMAANNTTTATEPAAPAPETAAGAPPAWGRDKAPGTPAQPALDHANLNAGLAAKAQGPAGEPSAKAFALPAQAAPQAHAATAEKTVQPAPPPQPAPEPVQAAAPAAPEAATTATAVAAEAPQLPRDKAEREKTDRKGEPKAAGASAGAPTPRAEATAPAQHPGKAAGEPGATAVRPDAPTGGDAKLAQAAPVEEAGPAPVEPPQQSATTSRPAAPAETAQASASPVAAVRGSPETMATLAAQIIKKLEGRSSRFDLELHPADLGRVDVRLEINAQGRLTAAMAFDTPQAASELKSRAGELQRALEQAGFDLSGGISFDVAQDRSGQGFARREQHEGGAAFRGRAFQAALETAGEADAAPAGSIRLRQGLRSGVDVKI